MLQSRCLKIRTSGLSAPVALPLGAKNHADRGCEAVGQSTPACWARTACSAAGNHHYPRRPPTGFDCSNAVKPLIGEVVAGLPQFGEGLMDDTLKAEILELWINIGS